MPLVRRCSQGAFDKNIRISIDDGKPQDQALAIAFSTLRSVCGVPKDASAKMKVPEILSYGEKKKEVAPLFSKLFGSIGAP